MPSYSLRIDYDAVRRKVNAAVAKSPASRRAAYDLAYTYFIRAKNAMLRQFNEHPITEEIESGRNAINLSGTLDGYGNLFSFIGFPSDERPVADLRALLQDSVTFRQTIFRDMTFYFRVSVPDRQDVEAASRKCHGNPETVGLTKSNAVYQEQIITCIKNGYRVVLKLVFKFR
jgi:hypothetical protein